MADMGLLRMQDLQRDLELSEAKVEELMQAWDKTKQEKAMLAAEVNSVTALQEKSTAGWMDAMEQERRKVYALEARVRDLEVEQPMAQATLMRAVQAEARVLELENAIMDGTGNKALLERQALGGNPGVVEANGALTAAWHDLDSAGCTSRDAHPLA